MGVGTLLLAGDLGLVPGTGRAMERVVGSGVNAHPGVGVGRMLRDASSLHRRYTFLIIIAFTVLK